MVGNTATNYLLNLMYRVAFLPEWTTWSHWLQSRKWTAVQHPCHAGQLTHTQVPHGTCSSLRCFEYLPRRHHAFVKSPLKKKITSRVKNQLPNRCGLSGLNLWVYAHDSLGDFGVSAHAEVVIAAPHRDFPLCLKGLRVVVCHGKWQGAPVHRLKNPVCVVYLLAFNLLFKKPVILEAQGWRKNKWNEDFIRLKICQTLKVNVIY